MKKEILTEKTANVIKEMIQENKEEFLTGEIDLVLTQKELRDKLLNLENGQPYINVLGTEHKILARQEVISLKFTDEGMFFHIPDWDSFITSLNAFHVACGPY